MVTKIPYTLQFMSWTYKYFQQIRPKINQMPVSSFSGKSI